MNKPADDGRGHGRFILVHRKVCPMNESWMRSFVRGTKAALEKILIENALWWEYN